MPPESNQEPRPAPDTSPAESHAPLNLPQNAESDPGAPVSLAGTTVSPTGASPIATTPQPAAPAATSESPKPAPDTAFVPAAPPHHSGNQPTVSDPVNVEAGSSGSQSKHRFTAKLLLLIVAGLLILGGGSAAAFYVYYTNPSTVWKQSLSNTGKGYDRLVGYLGTQANTHYSGFKESGSFKVSSDGGNYDGSLTSQTSGENSTASAKLDLGVTKIDLETRTIQASGASEPDIYLQVSGIKDLAGDLGPDLGPKVSALDGRWIVIDHNLLADLRQQLAKQQSRSAKLTWADIDSFLQAAGRVNQQYLFTTNKSTSVTTVIKSYGKETVNGHQTYHYKVGFVKAHVKAYVTALCGALQQSGLGTYLKQQTGQAVASSSECKDLEKSTDSIKSSDTVDVWADASHRLLYKVRVPDTTNPAQNFVDIGLDYKGGDSYPFFVSGHSKDSGTTGTYSVTATLNTSTNTLDVVVGASQKGSSALTLSGNFSVRPSNDKLKVAAPANAESITEVLNSFGLGSYLNQLENPGSQTNTPILSARGQNNAGKSVAGTVGSSGALQNALSPAALADYRNLTAAFKLP